MPAVADVTFEVRSFNGTDTKPNWGGIKTESLRPGNQDIDITMIPVTEIMSATQSSLSTAVITFDNIGLTYCKGYNIYRSTEENGDYKLIGYKPNAAGALSYIDDAVSVNTAYYYRVSVINGNDAEGLLCNAGSIFVKPYMVIPISQEFLTPGTYVLKKDGTFDLEASVAPSDILIVKGIKIDTLILVGGGGGSNAYTGAGGGSGLDISVSNVVLENIGFCTVYIGSGGSGGGGGNNNNKRPAASGGSGYTPGYNGGTGNTSSAGGSGGGGYGGGGSYGSTSGTDYATYGGKGGDGYCHIVGDIFYQP